MQIISRQQLFSIIISSFLLIFLLFNPVYVSSQADFREAYNLYSLSIEEYKKTHDNYVLTREQYLSFKTLQAETNAREATAKMLQARNDVVIEYFKTLKAKIAKTPGISDEDANDLNTRSDIEIAWYEDHKSRVPSAGTLEDLISDSEEASNRFEGNEPLVYEILSTISLGKVVNFRERINELFSSIKDKTVEIREEGRNEYKFSAEKLQDIDRWVFETEGRITRSQEKQQDSEEAISQIGEKQINDKAQYSRVLSSLGESHQYLKEASSFLGEVIREIKTE